MLKGICQETEWLERVRSSSFFLFFLLAHSWCYISCTERFTYWWTLEMHNLIRYNHSVTTTTYESVGKTLMDPFLRTLSPGFSLFLHIFQPRESPTSPSNKNPLESVLQSGHAICIYIHIHTCVYVVRGWLYTRNDRKKIHERLEVILNQVLSIPMINLHFSLHSRIFPIQLNLSSG